VSTDEERYLTGLIQPHVTAALGRIAGCGRLPVAGSGGPWVELEPNLRPIGLTPGQIETFHAYFPRWRPANASLPEAVARWITASVAELDRGASAKPLCVLRVESSRGRMMIRLFPHAHSQSYRLRLAESPSVDGLTSTYPGFGLTTRESEVLRWIASGKRNGEIATILGIAPGTVRKHMERIFDKFGVRNRTAVAAALQQSFR
jgi:DNA-binding CsgD family transcriptional regulator